MSLKNFFCGISVLTAVCLSLVSCSDSSDTESGFSSENVSTVTNFQETSAVTGTETQTTAAKTSTGSGTSTISTVSGTSTTSTSSGTSTSSKTSTTVTTESTTENLRLEKAVKAKSGEAFLAVTDSMWDVQYWGGMDDSEQLSYGAVTAKIDGDGDYTVSVNADTRGFRYAMTGDPDSPALPDKLGFLAVMIKDGEQLFPGASITINSVKVDGKELTLTSKAYTCSDDGIQTRANIYNPYVTEIPADAHCTEGYLYSQKNSAPAKFFGDYSYQIVRSSDFTGNWKNIEVNFTVTDTDGQKAPQQETTENQEVQNSSPQQPDYSYNNNNNYNNYNDYNNNNNNNYNNYDYSQYSQPEQYGYGEYNSYDYNYDDNNYNNYDSGYDYNNYGYGDNYYGW